jgi:hypothetical protein
VTLLLPQLVAGLGSGAGRDFAAATFMIVGRLAGRATLGAKLLSGGPFGGGSYGGPARDLAFALTRAWQEGGPRPGAAPGRRPAGRLMTRRETRRPPRADARGAWANL